jgi:hypothetical protein
MNIYFDIETVPEPLAKLAALMPEFTTPKNYKNKDLIAQNIADQRAKWIKEAALRPDSGKVMAIGLMIGDRSAVEPKTESDEKALLQWFWKTVDVIQKDDPHNFKLIAWSAFRFDLPFIVKRSWLHNVLIPAWVWGRDVGRYRFSDKFVDLEERWNLSTGDQYSSLDSCCRFFGLPVKPDLGGLLFHELYNGNNEQRKLALEYLTHDVSSLEQITKKIL